MGRFHLFGKKNKEQVPPEKTETVAEPPEPQKEPLPFLKKILVLVDGTAAGFSAFHKAVALASNLADCEVCAAFVVDTVSMNMLLQMHIFVKEECANFEAEMETKGRRTLEFIHAEGEAMGVDVENYLLKGRISKVVLQAIRELNVTLLVIGGWKSGASSKDTTSVENQLLVDQAECPVLVLKN